MCMGLTGHGVLWWVELISTPIWRIVLQCAYSPYLAASTAKVLRFLKLNSQRQIDSTASKSVERLVLRLVSLPSRCDCGVMLLFNIIRSLSLHLFLGVLEEWMLLITHEPVASEQSTIHVSTQENSMQLSNLIPGLSITPIASSTPNNERKAA